MPRLTRTLSVLITGLFWVAPVALAAAPLTLEAALHQAAAAHPDLTVQRRQLAVAETERIRAGFWLPDNPTVQGFYGPGGDSDLGVSVSQQFEIANQRGARLQIAEAVIGQAGADTAAFRQNALADVKGAFFDVLYWQERQSLAAASVTVTAELDRIARKRLAAQDIAAVDATQATMALEGAKARQVDIASQLQVSRVGLARLLGMSDSPDLAVTGTLPPGIQPPAASDAVSQAMAHRADLRALEAQLVQMQGQQALSQREIVPDPTLTLSYGRRATTKGNPGANVASDSGSTVQIGVSLPIPVVNYRQAELARNASERAVIEARQAALRTRIVQQVGEALASWQWRLPAAKTYAAMVPALQRTLTLLRAAYREGQIELQRVLLAQDQLIQNQTALLDVQRQLRQGDVSLDRALGRLDIDNKETP
ncbi:MAG: TolC family protein [Candidatus Sericytochromatia bacterium]|nr:TolC family protein [Candidatus Sericytochromatia bacterium]